MSKHPVTFIPREDLHKLQPGDNILMLYTSGIGDQRREHWIQGDIHENRLGAGNNVSLVDFVRKDYDPRTSIDLAANEIRSSPASLRDTNGPMAFPVITEEYPSIQCLIYKYN